MWSYLQSMQHAAVFAISLAVPFSAMADEPLTVEIVTVQRAPVSFSYELTGTVEATHSVPVSFRNGGRLLSITVDVGDRVAAGTVLAMVDGTQARAAEQVATAQIAAAEASLTQTQLTRNRVAELLERGAATRADLDSAEEALLAALAARDQAQTQVNTARQTVAETTIAAPISGIVTSRSADPGQVAGAAQAVLTIAPEKEREVVFYGPNHYLLAGLLGRKLEIRPIDGHGSPVSATISEISPLADQGTGTVTIKARLDHELADSSLGMPVVSRLDFETSPIFSMPWSSLATSEGKPAVWTVDPKTMAVALTEVEISRYTSDTVEIDAGLKDGDQVVAAGSHLLYPGRIVQAAGASQ